MNVCVGYNKPKGMTGVLHSAHYRDYYKCKCKGTIFENNKWYCKRHAPSKIKEREEKSWDNYVARLFKNK